MRFLLDFVYCCGTSNLRSEDSGYSTKPLVPPPSQNFRRKKRGAPDWRPSLGSISEDIAAAPRERGGPGAGRDVRRRSGGGAAVAPAVRVQRRYYSDDGDYDYRRNTMPTIMPAFSPTPFMF
ncbi:hypothetical protein HN51_043818 [Arachis hypogaea]|uniref:Uncharacterized protein n=1 Tax=Arachis hypogaea TaxID=3818 RepID=A0A444Y557_ARAHY|nr:uncharacterized protein LOC107614251 [Arachis ipaensis]XP_025672959.1 uncharacterized protein LOC112772265 [Arachis hypogaea]QHN95879.1 uncharacterized protein DS421_18g613540 [Arachis hypogaea]RYQ97063.1 hypothetical protein Ahy_B08g093053 isoform A [Arachis hypogaea]RYQ97064.1 hypothetical protein Ahy_B08g093053 isoform B [Arachis hypogaea]